MKTMDEILQNVAVQREVSEWESVVVHNLESLAKALTIASTERFMSLEHAKTIWKSYLTISGMDIPKSLKGKVLDFINNKEGN